MADLLCLVQVYSYSSIAETCGGVRGRGAHQATTDDGDTPPRDLIRWNGQERLRGFVSSGHAGPYGMDTTCRADLRAGWCW